MGVSCRMPADKAEAAECVYKALLEMPLATTFCVYNCLCRMVAEAIDHHGMEMSDFASVFLDAAPAAALDVMTMLANLRAWRRRADAEKAEGAA